MFRSRYVDQDKLLPAVLEDPSVLYARTTHIERTLVSAQRLLDGLYPAAARTVGETITIHQRACAPLRALCCAA
jgi:hypothetical protein